jgi:hypothetical protein
MLALMMEHEETRFAHPIYWAPFVIVGEGGVPAVMRLCRPRSLSASG